MQVGSVLGIAIALTALLVGQALEGGHLASILRLTSGLIVVGGTLGATLLSVSPAEGRLALRRLRSVWLHEPPDGIAIVRHYVDLAALARKDGIVALEQQLPRIPQPFLRRAIRHLVDGANEQTLRDILEADLAARLQQERAAAQVFEIAGGYAPTMGILGAVFGLIHAMDALADPARLGQGIAEAFVATVYGLGLANLLLLPIAARLRGRLSLRRIEDVMVIEGAIALQSGQHPRAVRTRLMAFLADSTNGPDEPR